MKTRWVLLCCLASLILGVGAASWFWREFYTSFMMMGFEQSTNAAIVTKISVLDRLRAGRGGEALAMQETLLDGDIIGAWALIKDGRVLSKNAVSALIRERDARATSHYEPGDPGVREAVQSVFASLRAGD